MNTGIRIFVEKGRRTLGRQRQLNYRRQSADRAVRYRAGVRDVDNHIVVRPVTELGAVKSRIEAALIRNGRLDAEHISVEVRGDSQRPPAIVDRA